MPTTILAQQIRPNNDDVLGNALQIAHGCFLTEADGFCPPYALEPLSRLDFGQLATAPKCAHIHLHGHCPTKRSSQRER